MNNMNKKANIYSFAPKDYRAYIFSHTMLKPICAGVQSAHCLAEMFADYTEVSSSENHVLHNWAKSHKTIILLDGGVTDNLVRINSIIRVLCSSVGLPFAHFNESNEYADGILTSVGFIIDANHSATDFDSIEEIFEYLVHHTDRDAINENKIYGILRALTNCMKLAG
jgi:hypothetical protein